MATLDFNTAIANVKTMLQGLSTWQSLCGVATTTEAAARIHEYGVDDRGDTTCPCIILEPVLDELTWQAGAFRGSLGCEIRIELAIPEENQRTYSTQGVWYWSKLSALMADITAAVGGGGELMADGLAIALRPAQIDPDENQGRIEWTSSLMLRVTFL